MNTDISYKVFLCFSASNMSSLCNMQKQYPFWSGLAWWSVAHYRSIMSQSAISDIRELRRRRGMMTNRLVNIWIHCVKMLQSLVSWFTTVHRPCINWRLWVSEPHGCFVCAFVYICTPSIYHFTAASSMLYLYQIWKASREGYAASLRATKISSTSSSSGTADQIKTIRDWTHRTESNKYVLLVDFCYQTVPRILFASSSHVFCDMAKKYNSGFTSIQLWPLWTCNAFCMFKLIMHFYFRLGKQVLSQWFQKKKKVCLMGVCRTPTFFPFLLSVSMGWAQGFSIEETLEIFELFPWKYLSVIH